ncbi:hypothetical protein ED28_03085 [[Pantoea] beijingensis]|uniref:Uncharacterized protein n=1 Tax=[Pantoea] beijingensis TaxID=1324864 RepID=A0A443IGT3_9GAMM|nr:MULTISPECIES: hypothetical protein [Erwiniaceae]RWR03295.1 hypothetical protein ED28_03085 [[Pantoea] beijingensis]
MKTKVALSVIAGLAFSATAFASTPASYDTKFNVSANVPDSAHITDPDGKPVTEVDVVLVASPSGKMEATVGDLYLWNNDVNKLDVSLILDDAGVGAGAPFTLKSTQGGTLNKMTYSIETIDSAGTKKFATSGASQDYTLTANGTHGEHEVAFHFISDEDYDKLGQGHYTGVVYANVNAKA